MATRIQTTYRMIITRTKDEMPSEDAVHDEAAQLEVFLWEVFKKKSESGVTVAIIPGKTKKLEF